MQAFPYLDTQINLLTQLTQKSFDTARTLGQLNLRLAQQLAEDAVSGSRQLLACAPYPYQWAAVAAKQGEPIVRHLRSYQQEVAGVFSGSPYRR